MRRGYHSTQRKYFNTIPRSGFLRLTLGYAIGLFLTGLFNINSYTLQTVGVIIGMMLRKQVKDQEKEIRRLKEDRPWKYQDLADAMRAINEEGACDDTYGRVRMYQALQLKQPEGILIPSERTVYRVMDEIDLTHRPRRKKENSMFQPSSTASSPVSLVWPWKII